MEWGLDRDKPFGPVTGSPVMSDVAKDDVEQIDGGLQWWDGGGTQSGSHPAKTQPKTMKFIEG